MSEHAWFHEQLPLYLTDGLDAPSAERMRDHAEGCAECGAELAEMSSLDATLRATFVNAIPDAALEAKLIDRLRAAETTPATPIAPQPQPSKRRWLRVLAMAASVLGLVALGGLGAVLSEMLDDQGGISFASNSLRRLAVIADKSESLGESLQGEFKAKEMPKAMDWRRPTLGFSADGMHLANERNEPFLTTDIDPNTTDFDTDISYNVDRRSDVSVPGLVSPNTGLGIMNGTTWSVPTTNLPAPGGFGFAGAGGSLGAQHGLSDETAPSAGYANGAPLTGSFFGRSGATRNKESKIAPSASTPLGREKQEEGERFIRRLRSEESLRFFDDFFLAQEKKPETPKNDLTKKLEDGNVKQKPAEPGMPPATDPVPPVQTRRVVIRSGDIEFEVDSFDDAVAIVTKLTNSTKGGFVATTNSKKRENGKMEGVVVLRVPPEQLDGLVDAIRKTLGKTGELKGQNISSQDVTKQYVDTESTLRAARTTEERLLKVIRDGKGEIKDLVIAEEKLGKVRTEIERAEGELRYFANLAALSTLSVKLTEKDFQAAAKLIESAAVQAAIEVEDVSKAQEELKKAIAEFKGRLIKSDSKQLSSGDFNVGLEFEVPADATEPMRDRLKKLGLVAKLDSDVVQRTEGGGAAPKDLKAEKGPTNFKVALVNVGQLPARDILRVAMASTDVRAAHQKMVEAVAAATGMIRVSNLDEKDRQNVTARLEFVVPIDEAKRIGETLASLGERLAASTERLPESDRATDQRIMFKVEWTPASRIEPRETHALAIEVRDVEGTLESIEGQFKGAGGRITVPRQLNQESNGRITAVVVYDVPLAEAEKMLKRLKSIGQVRVQRAKHQPTAPDGPLAIARFEVTLSNQEILVPRDQGVSSQVRQGVSIGLRGLFVSLTWLIVAVLFVGPWVLLIWGAIRLARRMRGA